MKTMYYMLLFETVIYLSIANKATRKKRYRWFQVTLIVRECVSAIWFIWDSSNSGSCGLIIDQSANVYYFYLIESFFDCIIALYLSLKFAARSLKIASSIDQDTESKTILLKLVRRTIFAAFIHFTALICMQIFIRTIDFLYEFWVQLYIFCTCYSIMITNGTIPNVLNIKCSDYCKIIEERCISRSCILRIYLCCVGKCDKASMEYFLFTNDNSLLQAIDLEIGTIKFFYRYNDITTKIAIETTKNKIIKNTDDCIPVLLL